MQINRLTPAYAVSPQIEPDDLAALREAGFTAVICNRPDAEVDAAHSADALRAAARDAGLVFHENPVVNGALGPEEVEAQRTILTAADGPVFAYCRSGTRSAIVWALGAAADQPVDEILGMARQAGYDLEGLRPQLERIAAGATF
ncbi:uncharacterized protein (TIGR01244 family) [Palleronia aestuarii]|uniref:Uncharacterized protein (TIGR01244 family) n=1 Tax=Palleronia aestuarii TaxID=568105 RepID=A0A2W7NHP8_9RHOB|nr:TIGR01244 family sulfur transferase [Palleronia aestuarii]PZX19778.1 uncharacterized protein (TIGR01244 family) [Palleronia aestuarii]